MPKLPSVQFDPKKAPNLLEWGTLELGDDDPNNIVGIHDDGETTYFAVRGQGTAVHAYIVVGEKIMSESSIPYAAYCPVSFLDLLTAPSDEDAAEWRDMVRANAKFGDVIQELIDEASPGDLLIFKHSHPMAEKLWTLRKTANPTDNLEAVGTVLPAFSQMVTFLADGGQMIRIEKSK